jgi:hypothetical protein
MRFRTEPWLTTSGPARSFLVTVPVLGVLAVLAVVLLPANARAETSSEVSYGEPSTLKSVPPVDSVGTPPPTKAHDHPHGTASHHGSPTSTTGEEATESVTEPGGESEPPEHHHAVTSPAGKGGNHPPGGSAEPGKNGSTRSTLDSGRKPVRNVTPGPEGSASAKPHSSAVGSGGSSPLLPILIAMAVLAAASIGVVIVRQRRGAGGPDGYAG